MLKRDAVYIGVSLSFFFNEKTWTSSVLFSATSLILRKMLYIMWNKNKCYHIPRVLITEPRIYNNYPLNAGFLSIYLMPPALRRHVIVKMN